MLADTRTGRHRLHGGAGAQATSYRVKAETPMFRSTADLPVATQSQDETGEIGIPNRGLLSDTSSDAVKTPGGRDRQSGRRTAPRTSRPKRMERIYTQRGRCSKILISRI